ncbi:bifunctional diguanylate cyclase/phosphodiesterase [Methylophilus aquaticus]|uniref:GGDEF domain-containing phosphodiesterase n=1 Tax=Methylophilus aquaticus TaxID=1971610 RepID=A0ABT9JRZ5_9PROT|nr:GGDEF domain-containing phosphodiesterase [Methylophilus aquaticus]MDP8567347.1 GGDEF domain-containing phosphodiesterase [Methylophilus aquaticus]
MITKELQPDVNALNEFNTTLLSLMNDVKEYASSSNIETSQRLVTEITIKEKNIGDALNQLAIQQAADPERHAKIILLTEAYQHLSIALKPLIASSLAQHSKAPLNLMPFYEAVHDVQRALHTAQQLNAQKTASIFNDLEHTELTIVGIYLFSMLMLSALLVFAGLKTYRKIIHLLGVEPREIFYIVNTLLDGRYVNFQTASPDSLLSSLKRVFLMDKETTLPNRLGTLQILPSLNKNNDATGMMLKIHGFDNLSEYLGPQDTKRLLRLFVERVKTIQPQAVLFSRVSNSSFLIVNAYRLISDERTHEIEALLQRVQEPYDVGIRKIKIKVFMGVVKYPEDTSDFRLLIKYANTAAAKAEKAPNQYAFFEAAYIKEIQEHIETETDLSHAIDDDQLELYLQPQVDIHTEKVVAAEVLLRWKHPLKGFISPDKFIPIAEKNGQILHIGDWVLEHAIAMAVDINQHRTEAIPLSINISSHQIMMETFVDSVCDKLNKYACMPNWIKLEITESALLDNSESVLRRLFQIASYGISISLDDFGTGYSSLSYLTRYPISQIKIDRTFMSDIPLHLDNTELVRAIIKLAEILHFDVVAEGIETADQLLFLRSTSCALVQGYYYFKPMPIESFKDKILSNLEALSS